MCHTFHQIISPDCRAYSYAPNRLQEEEWHRRQRSESRKSIETIKLQDSGKTTSGSLSYIWPCTCVTSVCRPDDRVDLLPCMPKSEGETVTRRRAIIDQAGYFDLLRSLPHWFPSLLEHRLLTSPKRAWMFATVDLNVEGLPDEVSVSVDVATLPDEAWADENVEFDFLGPAIFRCQRWRYCESRPKFFDLDFMNLCLSLFKVKWKGTTYPIQKTRWRNAGWSKLG